MIHLAGSALGAGLDGRWSSPLIPALWVTPILLTRMSSLLVALLCLKRGRLPTLVWGLVLAAAVLGGWTEATRRNGRSRVTALDLWTPAVLVENKGVGV